MLPQSSSRKVRSSGPPHRGMPMLLLSVPLSHSPQPAAVLLGFPKCSVSGPPEEHCSFKDLDLISR